MKIVGCDLHARQQTIAMADTETGEFSRKTLAHEGNMVREFYAATLDPKFFQQFQKPLHRPSGFDSCHHRTVQCRVVIQRRCGRRRRGTKSMIAAMRGRS